MSKKPIVYSDTERTLAARIIVTHDIRSERKSEQRILDMASRKLRPSDTWTYEGQKEELKDRLYSQQKKHKSLEEATEIATTVFLSIAFVCALAMFVGMLFSVVWLASIGLLGVILSGIYWLAWMVGARLS